jgi:hypothetical protein
LLPSRYKNFKCASHNKFFELNLYEKDPINTHHWRANVARPATEIDLLPTAARATGTGTTAQLPEAPVKNGKDTTTRSSAPSGPEVAPTSDSNIAFKKDDGDIVGFERQDRTERIMEGFNDCYSDSESEKDFTACSADDCGYCGHCTY